MEYMWTFLPWDWVLTITNPTKFLGSQRAGCVWLINYCVIIILKWITTKSKSSKVIMREEWNAHIVHKWSKYLWISFDNIMLSSHMKNVMQSFPISSVWLYMMIIIFLDFISVYFVRGYFIVGCYVHRWNFGAQSTFLTFDTTTKTHNSNTRYADIC